MMGNVLFTIVHYISCFAVCKVYKKLKYPSKIISFTKTLSTSLILNIEVQVLSKVLRYKLLLIKINNSFVR